jgi:hypothetical protein
MSDASGDPLYRSDSRTAPSGSQQADLAPVSDQPPEHWEQQAAQREAEEPPPPSDPLGAQPDQAAADSPDPSSPTPTAQTAPSTVAPQPQPAPEPTPQSAPITSEDSAAPAPAQTHDGSIEAAQSHGSTVTVGGETAWTDPGGDHVRSGEISIDASQATTLGGAMSIGQSADGLSGLIGTPTSMIGTALPVAEAALAQAVAAAQGGLAVIHDGGLTQVLTQVATVPASLEAITTEGLQPVSHALETVSSLTAPAIDAGLGEAIGVLTGPAEAVDDSLGAIDLVPIIDVAPAAPPSGLLASLFTPHEVATGGTTEAASHDLVPDIDLGGLMGPIDDHPDLGLPGL